MPHYSQLLFGVAGFLCCPNSLSDLDTTGITINTANHLTKGSILMATANISFSILQQAKYQWYDGAYRW